MWSNCNNSNPSTSAKPHYCNNNSDIEIHVIDYKYSFPIYFQEEIWFTYKTTTKHFTLNLETDILLLNCKSFDI